MSVQDKLPSSKPIVVLRGTKQTAQELKSSQRRGSTSIVMKRVFSDSSWDISTTGPAVIEILFTSDNMQFGGSFCYRMCGRKNSSSGTEDIDPITIQRKRTVNGVHRWLVLHGASGAVDFKFYFFSQGSGTFTVKKL